MKNVILLTLDATRKDVMGLYGDKKGLTPFIDSLQENSLVFTKNQSIGPYTQAAFPGILTSSYFLEYGKPKGLAPQRVLISEPLQKAGIVTAGFHSNPYCSELFGWNRGWDTFYDSMDDDVDDRIPYIQADVINQKAIAWLRDHVSNKGEQPFFLWVHYMDIHEPYMPEQKYVEKVDPDISLSADQMYELFTNTLLKRDVSDPDKVEMLKRLYDVHVREVDGYTQEFFKTLEELDLLNDTAVIITSDHGDEFNEHGGLSHDDKMYSELIDVPLILHGTGETGSCDKVVSCVDIPPTIMHLFGLEAPPAFQGQSLLPLNGYKEDGVFGEAIDQKSERGGNIEKDIYYYRKGNLKVICRADQDSWEMYDLAKDPGEQNNIAATAPEFEEMQNILKPRIRRWQ